MIISNKEILQYELVHGRQNQSLTNNNKEPKKQIIGDRRTLMDSGKVKCVEKHQRANPSYFLKNKLACKWGRKEGNVNTCGNCPFGIQLLEITPAQRKYLSNWEVRLDQWKWPNKHLTDVSPLKRSNKIEE
jgi:hypothetical protein